jgi:transposase
LTSFYRGFARYYANRYADASFHPLTHGGNRESQWQSKMRQRLEAKLQGIVKQNPLLNIRELAHDVGHGVNAMWVWRALRRLGISLKLIEYHNTNKYSLRNTIRYWKWLHRIHLIPWNKLKFADESHFTSRGNYILLLVI